MTATNMKDEAARLLLETRSVLFNAREPFTYTSGRKGPVYVDCRRLISFPDARKKLMDMAAETIRRECPGAAYIAGGETAGIPYAAFIAERLNLPMLYVRKKAKGFGRMSQIEGVMDETGREVVIVEDVQNYGTSVQVFIDALRAAEAVTKHIVVIFEYGHDSVRRAMQDLGVTIHSLADWPSILRVARNSKTLDAHTLDSVESFLKNPEDWAA